MNKVLLASAVSAAFAFAASSFAQSSESPAELPTIVAAAPAASASGSERAAPQRRAFRSPTDRVEARLAYLKTALKITDAQSAQWESFAAVMRKQAGDTEQRMQQRRAQFQKQGAERAERRNASAIDRLERTQQRMAARSARLNEVITAAKPLYAALTPEQQQIADTMLSRQGKRGGHGGHNRHGHRGHRGA
jgi:periplasmic protein CpxP/Spy